MAAVVYLRMAPALRDALRAHAQESGVSLNAFAVQALAAAAGPEFLRDVRVGGQSGVCAWYVGREAELAALAETSA